MGQGWEPSGRQHELQTQIRQGYGRQKQTRIRIHIWEKEQQTPVCKVHDTATTSLGQSIPNG